VRIRTTITALFCALLTVTGCGHHAEEHEHAAHKTIQADHDIELGLALNDGEKWPTDEHTRLAAARLALRGDKATEIHSQQEALVLAGDLDKELETLIQGCTMTGAAHDQLHVFLVALFQKVAALKEEKKLQELQRIRTDISSLLAAYEKHFE
jgi:hypothetical protein